MMNSIAIAGIHTGIGKTIAAAVLAEAMDADYWKPVQAGLEETDTETLKSLLSDGHRRVHAEAVRLTQPLSPHAAAEAEGIAIDHTQFIWPTTTRRLLVETAGGLLSPISANAVMADFISYYQLPAILVTQHYLGSINHTLLSLEVLRNRGIPLLGLVINGAENKSSEFFIESYTGIPVIARIPHFQVVDRAAISRSATAVRDSLAKYIP